MASAFDHHNQDATVYVGGLDERVDEELLWELFLQFGPVVSVSMPKDKVTNTHQGFGFVEFQSEIDAEYAVRVCGNITLYGKKIKVNKSNMDKRTLDVGANLFIGNLAPEVDEDMLKTTFIAFGQLACEPKIARDPETNISKGYGFVNYTTFEASDYAIESMNGQYFCNRPIVVQYAFKKEGRGERHGSAAERLLAGSNPDRARINAMMTSLAAQQQQQQAANPEMSAMMQPMLQPGMMQPGMMQPGMMQPGMMQPGMMQPGMMQPGMMQPGMMQPGMMQPGMMQPGMMQPGMMQPGMMPQQ
ncbi:hypothetical protein WA556_000117 [Blastocystis sp. ATCC 50177/Nand II]